jgi:hypothetical protein
MSLFGTLWYFGGQNVSVGNSRNYFKNDCYLGRLLFSFSKNYLMGIFVVLLYKLSKVSWQTLLIFSVKKVKGKNRIKFLNFHLIWI